MEKYNIKQSDIDKETEKKILTDLRSGEPFSFLQRGSELIIGVRSGYGDNHDEYNIFKTIVIKSKCGLIKK